MVEQKYPPPKDIQPDKKEKSAYAKAPLRRVKLLAQWLVLRGVVVEKKAERGVFFLRRFVSLLKKEK